MTQGDTRRLALGGWGGGGGMVAQQEAHCDPKEVDSTIHHNSLRLTQVSLESPRWTNATQGDSERPKMGDSGRPKGAQGDSGWPGGPQ